MKALCRKVKVSGLVDEKFTPENLVNNLQKPTDMQGNVHFDKKQKPTDMQGNVHFDKLQRLLGDGFPNKLMWDSECAVGLYNQVFDMENEHIIIQLNNGSVSMDTKWIKALYNLGIASFGNCPSNGLLFSKSSLNLDRRISCRCVDSKHCSKICDICGPVWYNNSKLFI